MDHVQRHEEFSYVGIGMVNGRDRKTVGRCCLGISRLAS